MPAHHHIDNEAKLLITTWEGEAIDIDFINAIKRYHKDFQNQLEYRDYNEVVNLTGITDIKLTTEGLKQIGQIAATTDQKRDQGKLAFIVNTNLAYGLVRVYMTYRNFGHDATKELRVFREESVALDWLKQSSPAILA